MKTKKKRRKEDSCKTFLEKVKTLDSKFGKSYATDGKVKPGMGSSASSNNAAHRNSLPPTLPGGNNRYTTQNKYSDWAGSRQSYIFKEKVQNPHARSSSLSRPGIHGPLKADHNIGILSSKDTLNRESGRERHGILRPLSRQKSSSLTDLSSFQRCKD